MLHGVYATHRIKLSSKIFPLKIFQKFTRIKINTRIGAQKCISNYPVAIYNLNLGFGFVDNVYNFQDHKTCMKLVGNTMSYSNQIC